MSRPAARQGDLTVTGDLITTGAPTVLSAGQPTARAADLVSGTACTGTVAAGSATVLVAGQPASRVGDAVTGVSSVGSPVTTSVAPPGAPTVLIGG